MSAEPKRIAGRYTVGKLLGTGGMSRIYRAWDEEKQQDVALKLLHNELRASVMAQRRFMREAEMLARVSHPNVVRVFDYGESRDEEPAYLVLEFLKGMDLWGLSRRQMPYKLLRIRSFALDACRGLAALHAKDIVHRDVKPENLFITKGARELLKVIDLGVAYTPGSPEPTSSMVSGSPGYRSPEQLAGIDVDARSDIWSLGVVLYELVTDMAPFPGNTVDEMERNVCRGAFTPMRPTWDGLPEAVCLAIECCLEPDADDRFSSMEELATTLEEAWQADVQDTEAADAH